jgi:hypothetical protein
MILVATSGGLGFLSGGSNARSLQMASGFMGAFLSYATGFYVTKTSDGSGTCLQAREPGDNRPGTPAVGVEPGGLAATCQLRRARAA